MALSALALAGVPAAQVGPIVDTKLQVQAPVRDPSQIVNGRGPAFRQVPIGTAAIVGTVTAADTGRPLAGAAVNLSGMATVSSPGRSGAPQPIANALVAGLVNSSTGLPLGRALVTDAQGRFVFQRLPAGQFMLNVICDQYLPTSYGQKKANRPGTPIPVTDGQQVSVTIPMMRGGAITGQVIGDDGTPLMNAQVRALRYVNAGGFKRLSQMRFAASDDRGIYRLFGLEPGDYLVAATQNSSQAMMIERMRADMEAVEQAIAAAPPQSPASGQPMTVTVPVRQPMAYDNNPPGYAPTYYPSAATPASASVVSVGAGEERSSVDIAVQDIRASNVRGTVTNAAASAGVAVQVSILPDDPTDGSINQSTRAGPDGRFILRDIPPGQYTVVAQTVPGPPIPPPGGFGPTNPPSPPRLDDASRLWGRAQVTVDGPATPDLTIPLQPGKSISGRVAFETQTMPDLTRAALMVTVTNAPSPQINYSGPSPQARVTPDGRFTLNGISPGRYTLRLSGGLEKSAVVDGVDTLDFPLNFTAEHDITDAVITATDKLTELSGTLTDAAGKPAVEYTVVLAAADSRYWTPGSRRILVGRLGPDGRYTFRNMPAGDYLVAAAADLDNGGQYDPEFLKSLANASVHVVVAEGAKQTQDLRVAR